MAKRTLAGEWMEENGFSWKKRGPGSISNNHHKKKPLAKTRSGRQVREARAGEVSFDTIRGFVDDHRGFDGEECLFVPHALVNRPAAIEFCGKNISAARYMALLTHGAPNHEGMVTRHTCGNGHLSCVNPRHIIWGTQADNIGDMARHRAAERQGKAKTAPFEE